jgi:DEAD/DEAH box helicase domain-containing protein
MGFSVVPGHQRLTRYTTLTDQYIAEDQPSPRSFDPDPSGQTLKDFWLAAPKTTDALFLAPACICKGLRLHLVGTVQHGGVTAVRAAALSAIFLIVNRAARELDIAPEEFDVIEPRMYRPENGDPIPLLQITDHLVNGQASASASSGKNKGAAKHLS